MMRVGGVGPGGYRCWSTTHRCWSICIHPIALQHTARSECDLVSSLGAPGPTPTLITTARGHTRWRCGGCAARKERLSGCDPQVETLTWLLPLTLVMTVLARSAIRKAAMACGDPPPCMSIPRDGPRQPSRTGA